MVWIFNTAYFWRVKPIKCLWRRTYSEVGNFRTFTVNCETYRADGLPTKISDAMGSLEKSTAVNLDIYDQAVIQDLDVNVSIDHGYIGDISLYLVAPDNTRIKLAQNLGDDQDDYRDTVFDQEGTGSIVFALPPFTGSLDPRKICRYLTVKI